MSPNQYSRLDVGGRKTRVYPGSLDEKALPENRVETYLRDASVKRLLENRAWGSASLVFRKGAGVVILLLGLYFFSAPFVSV